MTCDMLLIDARHLLWRNADANKELHVVENGVEVGTGAIYGWLSSAFRIHQRHGGTVVVAWESADGSNFRRRLFPGYKKRDFTEEQLLHVQDMHRQEAVLKELLSTVGVRQFEAIDCEADDVMGTVAARAAREDLKVLIYSGDSDVRQLVTEEISVVSPGYQGSGETLYDVEKVREKHGVAPWQIPHLKAIAGDNSDKVPGVNGIGEKGALKLITRYGTVLKAAAAAINEDPEFPLSERLRNALAAQAEEALRFLVVCTIKKDARVHQLPRARDIKGVRGFFQRLRFKSLNGAQEFTSIMAMGGPR